MSRGVDVLAVLSEQIEASRNSIPHLPEVVHQKINEAIEEVEAVRAAVAELIEVLDVAAYGEYLPETVEQEIRSALARAQGAA